jgi:5-methylcytosine-specific restriction endonuclease McrA
MREQARSLSKPHRDRLEGKEYRQLVQKVFERDRWTCRNPYCQTTRNLTPHHLKRRSQLGGDTIGNLITLCVPCHGAVERNELKIEVVDVVVKFRKKD